VNRRALLLGALLMPTAAHARTTRQTTKHKAKQAVKKPVAPPKAPIGPQPLKEAKTELIAFNASAFPYRGLMPGTKKPFLDARDGKRLGHTALNGGVLWEDQTFSDRRSLLYLPAGFDPKLPVMMVLYLHGHSATLEQDVVERQAVPRQLAESGKNVALVAPQLAFDAADSSAGNFWRPGHFAAYIDEAAERLMRLYGDKSAGAAFNAASVVIVSYSGGYLTTAYMLAYGGAVHRIKGVVLMDSLYGEEDKFAAWISARRRLAFLFSAYTDSTKDDHVTLESMLAKRRISYTTTMPASLTPGTFSFLPCGAADLHVDFVTRAWGPDPLKQVIAKIPGYAPPPSAPAKPVHVKKNS
jgi:hypothetical protein